MSSSVQNRLTGLQGPLLVRAGIWRLLSRDGNLHSRFFWLDLPTVLLFRLTLMANRWQVVEELRRMWMDGLTRRGVACEAALIPRDRGGLCCLRNLAKTEGVTNSRGLL